MAVEMTVERQAGISHVELLIKPPDWYRVVITNERGTTTHILHAAPTYDLVKVTPPPSRMKVTGIERIGARDAYAVAYDGGTAYFDVASGLLLRTIAIKETILAPMPQQADFEDYRDVDGVKLPFLIRTSDAAPFDTAKRTMTSIRRGIEIVPPP
jgi:hypothetical protein